MVISSPNDLITEEYLLQEGWTCERNEDGEYIYRLSNIYQFVIIRYSRYYDEFYIDGTDIKLKYVRHYLDLIKICNEENE